MTQLALRRLRFNEVAVRRTSAIVAHHMRPLLLANGEQPPSARAVFRYYRDLDDAGVDVAVLSLSDLSATAGIEPGSDDWQRVMSVTTRLLHDYFDRVTEAVAPPALVDGNDLMTALRLPPGRLVGQLLLAIAEAQAAGEVHSAQEALDYATQFAAHSMRATQPGITPGCVLVRLPTRDLMASEVCPLLGLDDDRGAYLTYPSYENRCYAPDAAELIPLNEQTFFCLGGHMERCPRYQARQASQPSGEFAASGSAATEPGDSAAQDSFSSWDSRICSAYRLQRYHLLWRRFCMGRGVRYGLDRRWAGLATSSPSSGCMAPGGAGRAVPEAGLAAIAGRRHP